MLIPDVSATETSKASSGNETPKRYSGILAKSGFLLLETDKQLIRDNSHTVREALFACSTRQQVECAVAFARYLSFAGLNSDNYWLFLRLIMTNNPWVVDELLHDRIPRLLFSTIRPDNDLIDAAFEMLFSRHPDEIYSKSLESVLGIIQNAYFDPDDGYRLRKLTIMDINALGKFLIKDQAQDHPLNKLLLEILDRITHVGEYYGEQDKNVLSKHAFNVRYAYFDHTRNLVDAIPEPLLVRMNDVTGVPPEEDYADLVSNRRAHKRDVHGRFIKDYSDDVFPVANAGGARGLNQPTNPGAVLPTETEKGNESSVMSPAPNSQVEKKQTQQNIKEKADLIKPETPKNAPVKQETQKTVKGKSNKTDNGKTKSDR